MPKRFGLNSDWSLDSTIGTLEAILQDEEEIEERHHSKKREQNLEKMADAIELLYECCE